MTDAAVRPAHDDVHTEVGGEPPCWAHLVDDLDRDTPTGDERSLLCEAEARGTPASTGEGRSGFPGLRRSADSDRFEVGDGDDGAVDSSGDPVGE